MATIGCAASRPLCTLPSMRQLNALHPLGCRSASTLLPHPCKRGSIVFFVFLPTRLNPITCCKRRPLLSPPLCGHGDLEIVSVKELADGFLHFSFGAPSNAIASSKADELSSSYGERLAKKLSAPRRLPSKFSKKSPIPVQQRKRQVENSTKKGLAEGTPVSIKVATKSSSRPKSCFVKRSPIPIGKRVQSSQSEIVLDAANAQCTSQSMPQGTQIGSLEVKISRRPPSAFVRKSPVSKTASNHIRSLQPSAKPELLSDKAGDTAVKSQGKSVVASRPKSVFSRRSPILRAHTLLSQVSTDKTLQPSHKNLSNVEDASEKSATISASSSQDNVDLQKCKLADLRNLAKTKGLKGYSKLKKGELLNLLEDLDS